MKKTTNKLTKTEKVKRLRERLVKACDAHVKSGKKVIAGHFHDTSIDGCCPIGCLVGDPVDENYSDALRKKLKFGFTPEDMWAFIDGFDGNSQSIHIGAPEFKLGQELREKYIEKPAKEKK